MSFQGMFRDGARVSIGRVALTGHAGRRVGAVALAALLAVPAAGVVAFRQAPADPSPAVGDARVIAQGVVPVGPGDLVWQVSQASAQPPANAEAIEARTGFLLAGDGAMLVEDVSGDEQVRLANGEATLTMAGERQVRAALGSNATGYAAIELIPAAEATEGSGFISAPFAGDGARRDLDLVADSLLPGETLDLPAGAGPTAVLVTAGSVDVATAAGEVFPLAAGEALTADGGLTATAGEAGADLVAAVIGPATPSLAEQTQAVPAGTPAAVVEVAPAPEEPAPATPVAAAPAAATDDEDGDGLTLAEEDELNTDPVLADTDGDGLSDGDEVNVYGTLPLIDDSDGDGIIDGDAVATGVIVAADVAAPNAAAQAAEVVDEPAAVEEPAPVVVEEPVPVVEEPAPVVEEPAPVAEEPTGLPGDTDGDFLQDVDEAAIGTDPFNPDTDADGLLDGSEVFDLSLGPLNPDNDGDGVLDGDEINNGTDPNDPGSF